MRKLGKIFKYKNKRLITLIENDGCSGCYFYIPSESECKQPRFQCLSDERIDNLSVIFSLIKFKYGQ